MTLTRYERPPVSHASQTNTATTPRVPTRNHPRARVRLDVQRRASQRDHWGGAKPAVSTAAALVTVPRQANPGGSGEPSGGYSGPPPRAIASTSAGLLFRMFPTAWLTGW